MSFAIPALSLLPTPQEEGDVYNNPVVFPFIPYSQQPVTMPDRNFALLDDLDYIPMTNDTHVVTDCSTQDVSRLVNLTSGYFRVNVSDAILANNMSLLQARGYARPDGTFINYLGGGLFFMKDGGAGNRFNRNGSCSVWVEQLVLTATDDHWMTFTGANFAAMYPGVASANVRAVIDGSQLPSSSVSVRDNGLIDVLVPSAMGRRRLQIDVNGVRTTGVVLVNAKPVVHGFMEWRLAMEDVRGPSPASEDPGNWNSTALQGGMAEWGGFGAWNETLQCHRIGIVGFHFGGADALASGNIIVVAGDQPCQLVEDARHVRITCCQAYTFTSIVVITAGQRSTPVNFSAPDMVFKPVVQVPAIGIA